MRIILILSALTLSACGTTAYRTCEPTLGMNQQQVLDLCGHPTKVNRTEADYGTRQQWRYGVHGGQIYPVRYMYFEDGRLRAIQD